MHVLVLTAPKGGGGTGFTGSSSVFVGTSGF